MPNVGIDRGHNRRRTKASFTFPLVLLKDLPDRRSKHRNTVSKVLSALEKLDMHRALKIDLVRTGPAKAAFRAALHRAARKERVDLATTSDAAHLYVFRRPPESRQKSLERLSQSIQVLDQRISTLKNLVSAIAGDFPNR